MKHFSETHRLRMSESAKARCTPEWRKNLSEKYCLKLDGEKIRRLYESGMSQVEVAAELGVSQKAIFGHMRRHGITTRPRVKRNQTGANNDSWRGDTAKYAAFHRRVESLRGKPKLCAECGQNDPSLRYEWANLTGHYEDIDDYRRMCKRCHATYDEVHLNFTNPNPNKRKEMDNARRQ